ncbi:MAG: aminopeptidase P N-terminal domain-containing protein [Bacteroidales bacterium]|jgi:Xaa-Pro aminopeptidase|nr:aminopeptidase P N-terminal domain-containing protein [Bacteroidales bacterium]
MRYSPIATSLFVRNREKIIAQLPENSMAIICGADQVHRNDELYRYRQSSDFFYLTGIEQEDSFLLLLPHGTLKHTQAILFVREPNPLMERWEGKKLTAAEATEISGIHTICSNNTFIQTIAELLPHVSTVFLNQSNNRRYKQVLTREMRLGHILRKRYKHIQLHNCAPLLNACRMIKEPEEIALMQYACNITEQAFRSVLKNIKPGMREYEVEALLWHTFIAEGVSHHAFEPIVAAGENSCFLHYQKNDSIITAHDSILIDFGAEYANYAADCTRVIPASGKFSKQQTLVYNAVLRVFYFARTQIIAGTSIEAYHKLVCHAMQEELLQLGLISTADVQNGIDGKPAYFKYFMHNTSHFIGLDIHDVGKRSDILQPNMVVSCEPGLYVPEWGFGVRLESDIVITETGNYDLMQNIPIEIEEIESLINE